MNIRVFCMCAAVIILSSCSIPWGKYKEAGQTGTEDSIFQEYPAASGTFAEEAVDLCISMQGDEQDHCYQKKAWEEGDFTICRKIQGERFAYLVGNPPRDKCFSMVASKKCDPIICDFIQGGQRYFSPTECKQRISMDCP